MLLAQPAAASQSKIAQLARNVETAGQQWPRPDDLAHAARMQREYVSAFGAIDDATALRGETDDEIERTLDDLRAASVDVVTMGQYMRPTKNHLPVERFVTPEQFHQYREMGLAKGFLEVVSGPLVRSSYRAEQVLEHNNVGLDPVIADGIREAASMRC